MKRILLALKLVLLFGFTFLVHVVDLGPRPGTADALLDASWSEFASTYHVDRFGEDGYFVRAVRNGHRLINKTYDHAWRFTRKTQADEVNRCGHCHSPEDLAYAFVNSDRYDPRLAKRVSFEERVMRCYVKNLDGFVPTIYDPAIRDIRIFARLVAHDLRLVEGSVKGMPR